MKKLFSVYRASKWLNFMFLYTCVMGLRRALTSLCREMAINIKLSNTFDNYYIFKLPKNHIIHSKYYVKWLDSVVCLILVFNDVKPNVNLILNRMD